MRVELCAVVLSAAVQGDDFVTNDIVAGPQVPGNRSCRSEVAPDESVSDPCLRARGDDGGLGDLAPAEGAGGQRCAVAWTSISFVCGDARRDAHRCKEQYS